MFIQLSKKNVASFRRLYNHFRLSIRRRGASKQDILYLIEYEKILDKIDGKKDLFKKEQVYGIER